MIKPTQCQWKTSMWGTGAELQLPQENECGNHQNGANNKQHFSCLEAPSAIRYHQPSVHCNESVVLHSRPSVQRQLHCGHHSPEQHFRIANQRYPRGPDNLHNNTIFAASGCTPVADDGAGSRPLSDVTRSICRPAVSAPYFEGGYRDPSSSTHPSFSESNLRPSGAFLGSPSFPETVKRQSASFAEHSAFYVGDTCSPHIRPANGSIPRCDRHHVDYDVFLPVETVKYETLAGRAFDAASRVSCGKGHEGVDGEEEEKEDPDSDAEDSHGACCSPALRSWLRAIFPNAQPFVWFALQLLVCFLMLMVGLESGSTSKAEFVLGQKTTGGSTQNSVEIHLIGDITSHSLLLQGSTAFFKVVALNVAFWLAFMLARVLIIMGLLQALRSGMPAASAFSATIDPEIFYVPWSIFVYVWWLGNAKESHLVLLPKGETSGGEPLMYFLMFGPSLLLTPSVLRVIMITNVVFMVLAARRLVLAVMVFGFELGFLMNINAQITNYLKRYGAIRKLNAKWMLSVSKRLVREQNAPPSNSWSFYSQAPAYEEEQPKAANFKAQLEQRLRHVLRPLRSSLCLFASVPRHPRLLQASAWVRSKADGGATLGTGLDAASRKGLDGLSRLGIGRGALPRGRQEEFAYALAQGTVIPPPLRASNIELAKTSKVRNWLSIHFCLESTPCLFLYGRCMKFDDKEIARGAADLFFQELLKDAERLQAEKRSANSPPQHDFHQRDLPLPEKSYGHAEHHVMHSLQQVNLRDASAVQRQCLPGECGQSQEGNAGEKHDTAVSGPPKYHMGATPAPISCLSNPSTVETRVSEFRRNHFASDVPKKRSALRRRSNTPSHSGQAIPRMPEALSSNPSSSKTPSRNNDHRICLETATEKLVSGCLAVEEEDQGGLLSPQDSLRALTSSHTVDGTSSACPVTRSSSAETLHLCAQKTAADDGEVLLPAAEEASILRKSSRTYVVSNATSVPLAGEVETRTNKSDRVQRSDTTTQEREHNDGEILAESRTTTRIKQAFPDYTRKRHYQYGGPENCAQPKAPLPLMTREASIRDSDVVWSPQSAEAAKQASPISQEFQSNASSMEGNKTFHHECAVRHRKRLRSSKSPRKALVGQDETPLRRTSSLSSGKAEEPGAEKHSRLPTVDASSTKIPEDKFADPEKNQEQDIRMDERSASGCRPTPNEVKYLDLQVLELYVKPDEAEEFMKQADLAGHGKIDSAMFQRSVLQVYNLRKRLVRALKSQTSIASTVLRMISVLLWFVALIVLLLVMGVDMNTVVVSGAAFLSAMTVSLSYIYQHFITAVIFVAFTNPYNIGDRVRVDGGDILYVRRIRTYTTEFESMHGKPIIYSNANLFSRVITNESRAKTSSFELTVSVSIFTPVAALRALEADLKKYVEARDMLFVKDSFRVIVTEVRPGHYIKMSIWLTCVEGWGNWTKVFKVRTDVFLHLVKLLAKHRISFHMPQQPIALVKSSFS